MHISSIAVGLISDDRTYLDENTWSEIPGLEEIIRINYKKELKPSQFMEAIFDHCVGFGENKGYILSKNIAEVLVDFFLERTPY